MDSQLSKRRIVKGRITRFETIVAGHATAPITPIATAMYKKKIETLAEELEAVHDSIMSLCPPADLDVHETEYNQLVTRVESMTIFFNTLKSQAPLIQTTADIKLPKLELPSFGGSYVDWFPFHDLFTATVHNNGSLAGAQKFQYLKASLRDEAALLIQSIPVTDGNYVEAWDILLNRFNNTREIINAHIKRLFGQPVVREESTAAIRHLIDTTSECMRALKVLKEPVQHWDAILLHVIGEKLDPESRRQWELSLKGTSRPTYAELTEFLEQKARALANVQSTSMQPRNKPVMNTRRGTLSHHGSVRDNACILCAESHFIYKCPSFLKATSEERWNIIKKNSLCFNCLGRDHLSNDCQAGSCRKCSSKHNTLLHQDTRERKSISNTRASTPVVSHVSRQYLQMSQVILPTVLIQVEGADGQSWPVRALLDSGSQASFVSEQIMQKLHLGRTHLNATIGGIGAVGLSQARGRATLIIRSGSQPSVKINIQALVLSQVTSKLPNFTFNPQYWKHLKGLQLADPTFHITGVVDVLLGADVYLDIIQDGKLHGQLGTPGAFNTIFGWAVAGQLGKGSSNKLAAVKVNHCSLDQQLAKFWTLEELVPRQILTSTEKQCEHIFQETHKRDTMGRYILKLPIKDDAVCLGNSRKIALRRFEHVERRLQLKPELYDQYRSFMDEYLTLGHMELIPAENIHDDHTYYLPHHAVLKESSTTTKLRVVFDASTKTSNGVSLNDILLVGPKLQDDLVQLLIRFRCYAIALTADLEKMYRQIWIRSEDTNYQRIVWRRNPEDPIQDYKLRTVTYGTAAAPYLATKVLKQLAKDIQSTYPLAAQALSEDFYMDDLLSGAEDIPTAVKLQTELIQATKEGGFNLRKWSSNETALLASLPAELREVPVSLKIDEVNTIQTLGLQWTPSTDCLSYTVKSPERRNIITKRTILSDTAKVFDPLGLLSPVIIRAKLLLQEMWQVKFEWDQELPALLITKWNLFREDLIGIEDLRIPRYVSQQQVKEISLHGFCDASEKAYAAAVYLKTKTLTGVIKVQLIAAKTKVAPLKQITLPRLELCAAVLLARVITLVQESMTNNIAEVHGWSDSQIVLAWLASPPQRWKTFVANRVAEIHEVTPEIQWHHVPGDSNPADCASRGIPVHELNQHPLWWHGPSWLETDMIYDQVATHEVPTRCTIEERIPPTVVVHCKLDHTLLDKYSSLSTLIHVTAYIQRFIRNLKTCRPLREIGPLTSIENEQALNHWLRITQLENFGDEIHQLKTNKSLSVKSKLLSLTPFLDKDGLLRVGGRIRHANLPVDQIHPVILPRKSRMTTLLVSQEHLKTLHGGTQLMMAGLQSRYWILGLRDIIRYYVRRCICCVRQQAKTVSQLMGDLPTARVNPGRAFITCGVDYAGPFQLKVMKGRGQRCFKGYIAVFICFTTRAIHLELVSDMSTDAFLAAFKRFVSRRGRCTNIYSDNGSNFVGASRELKDFLTTVSTTTTNQTTARWMSDEGITWHFNPPAAPHFGGLWEAGVKSVKYHLKRVLGETKLNFEEMQTLLCQIEACLNSRPLSPMTSDPTDLAVLTPGHFLIGQPLNSIPEPDFTATKVNRLSRWQLSQQLVQHFWKRWQAEYITRLQQRPKWTHPNRNVRPGDLVLLKEELPPTKWRMARVIQVHPGEDQLVRVVTVKTAEKEFKRPVVKLCLLPLDP